MDDIQNTINKLQCVKKLAKLPKYGVTAIETAISAMQELEQYRQFGTVEQVQYQKHNLGIAYNMLGKYQIAGTPEECREAVKRQQAIPPRKAPLFEGKQAEIVERNEIKNYNTYRCPECGKIVAERGFTKSIFLNGFIKHKFCRNCGQHIDWGDEYD